MASAVARQSCFTFSIMIIVLMFVSDVFAVVAMSSVNKSMIELVSAATDRCNSGFSFSTYVGSFMMCAMRNSCA